MIGDGQAYDLQARAAPPQNENSAGDNMGSIGPGSPNALEAEASTPTFITSGPKVQPAPSKVDNSASDTNSAQPPTVTGGSATIHSLLSFQLLALMFGVVSVLMVG